MGSHKQKLSHCPKASELQAGHLPVMPVTCFAENLKIYGQALQQSGHNDEGRKRERKQRRGRREEKRMAKMLFSSASGSIWPHVLNSQQAFLALCLVLQYIFLHLLTVG